MDGPSLLLLSCVVIILFFCALGVWAARHWSGRIVLGAVICLVGGWGIHILVTANRMHEDLDTRDIYDLPADTPGRHSIQIKPLSQGSMLGVLVGIDGARAPEVFSTTEALAACSWEFTEGVNAQWFNWAYEGSCIDTSVEVKLFLRSGWNSMPDPIVLAYTVTEDNASQLRSVQLVVRHDRSAAHMLHDHGAVFANLFGGVAVGWSALWLVVLVVIVVTKRKSIESA